MHQLTIRAKYATKFASTFNLINRLKEVQEKNYECDHQNYAAYNDVVLDKIVEIVDVPNGCDIYSKVYDVTVPSTLNFALANGLILYDTSDIGYLQRKLVKAMEDCKVYYDGSVRNANGSIIQFLYGDDGMDAAMVESQVVPYASISAAECTARYSFNSANLTDLKKILTPDACKATVSYLEKGNGKARMQAHVQQLLKDRDFILVKMFKGKLEKSVFFPVCLSRIIGIARTTIESTMGQLVSDLTPQYVLDTLDSLEADMVVNPATPNEGNGLFKMLLRAYLSPKEVIMHHQLTRPSFDYVVAEVRQRFKKSMIHPSEMVGVVAAQSIGEPATQLTLNSFHLSGISSASETVRGVPRLKELLSFSKKMKTPSMRIFMNPDSHTQSNRLFDSKQACLERMNDIVTVRFRDVVQSTAIYYDPHDKFVPDQPFIKASACFQNLDESNNDNKVIGPWVIRVLFKKEAMMQYKVDLPTLHQCLCDYYGTHRVNIMISDDNSENLVMRIKLTDESTSSEDKDKLEDDLLTEIKALEASLLENVTIKGIPNIERAIPDSDKVLSPDKISEYNPLSNEFELREEWYLATEGTNFSTILSLPYVDPYRTTTNNIIEVYEVLGIEAVRNALYNEIVAVLANEHVDYRHIAMLVDMQTNKGTLMSIDRHGINRGDIGPLAKCSFEETTEKLIKAGAFSEYDRINGVSANIMLGQIAPAGTGDCEVLIDESKLMFKSKRSANTDDQIIDDDDVDRCVPENFTVTTFVAPAPLPAPILMRRARNTIVAH